MGGFLGTPAQVASWLHLDPSPCCIDKASELHEGGGISFFLIEQLHINLPHTAGAKSKLVIG